MNKYKAVIFDLDGTLLDTIDDLGDSMNHVLSLYGIAPFTKKDYFLFVGDGVDALVERVLTHSNQSLEIKTKVKELYMQEYAKKQRNKTTPYQGIPELLDALLQEKVLINVLSNKPDKDTISVISAFFKEVPFTYIYGKKDHYLPKPDAKLLEEMIRLLHLPKSEILYVGDTSTDILTAKRAGLSSVGCLWGFRDEEELKNAQATFIVKHPLEILSIVKEGI
ncbi:MAG: HAD family hydrolase [Firmicutes bacterium]|nr:HAD family hydrolase [Bacillota bacterium]